MCIIHNFFKENTVIMIWTTVISFCVHKMFENPQINERKELLFGNGLMK